MGVCWKENLNRPGDPAANKTREEAREKKMSNGKLTAGMLKLGLTAATLAFASGACLDDFQEVKMEAHPKSPIDGAIVTEDLVDFEWMPPHNDAGVDYYTIRVNSEPHPDNQEYPNLGSGIRHSALDVPMAYHNYPDGYVRWSIASSNGINQVPSLDFRLLVTLPPPPLVTPLDKVCIIDETFGWDPVEDATDYELRVYTGSGNDALSDTNVLKVQQTDETSFRFEGDNLLPVGNYEWTVVPLVNGIRGIPSTIRAVEVVAPIPAPSGLVTAANPNQPYGPYAGPFSWDATTPDTGYEFELYSGACETGTLVHSETLAPGQTSVTLSPQLQPLTFTNYFWRVRAMQNSPCPPNPWTPCKPFLLDACAVPEEAVFSTAPVCPGGTTRIEWESKGGLTYQPQFSWDGTTWEDVMTFDSNAFPAWAELQAPFGGGLKTYNYVQTADIPIPTKSTVYTMVVVPTTANCAVLDIRTKVNIDHNYVGQLILTMISPTGTRVELVRNWGGTGDDFRETWFHTADGTNWSAAPFTGVFKPEESMFTYVDEPAPGGWILEVKNTGDTPGMIQDWTVEFQCPEPGPPAPGYWRVLVENLCGQALPMTGLQTQLDETPIITPALTFDSSIGTNCNVGSAVSWTFTTGYSYRVEFYDAASGSWEEVDQTFCEVDGTTITCDIGDISAGSGSGYQWRVTAISPEGCLTLPKYTETFSSKFIPSPWNGTGFFIKSRTLVSGTDGINDEWIVEDICPDPWSNGMTVGDEIISYTGSWASCPAPSCGSGSCSSGCGVPVGPVGTLGQSWFTATKAWFLTVSTPVTLKLSLPSYVEDAVHLDIFQLGTEPPPGPPGNTGAIVSRQACIGYNDAFGCVAGAPAGSPGATNLTSFTISPGCYLLRNTTVDSTGGTCVTFAPNLCNPLAPGCT
jgi:hypothetical protein